MKFDDSPAEHELVFGMIAPLGVDLLVVTTALTQILASPGYSVVEVRLTDKLLAEQGVTRPTAFDEYIHLMQDAGQQFRKRHSRGDALALAAVETIRERRQQSRAAGAAGSGKVAFLLRQLKTPDEVSALRDIYGSRLFVLGLYDTIERRTEMVAKEIANSRGVTSKTDSKLSTAHALIARDMAEEADYGQNVRDAYPLADVFVDCSESSRVIGQIRRFVELLFGAPFLPPTAEEYLMFLARAVALRSSDLSRQVGAVITTTAGSVISVGMNEVPKVGGGAYGEGDSPDNRDFKSRTERGQQLKQETLQEVLSKLQDAGWLQPAQQAKGASELVPDALELMKGTRLLGLGEFQRVVHAEMTAVNDAARRGVAIEGTVLFATTFPCQNCAKHLIGAGVRAIVYLEPYPKSLTGVLHDEECAHRSMTTLRDIGNQIAEQDRLGPKRFLLCAYIGLAPRLYQSLFAMPVRKTPEGNPVEWNLSPERSPRLTRRHDLQRITLEEQRALQMLSINSKE